jgi:hypothetical protein
MSFKADKAIAPIILCSCLLSNEFEDPSTILHYFMPRMSLLCPTWTMIDLFLLLFLTKQTCICYKNFSCPRKSRRRKTSSLVFSCKDLDFECRILFAWSTTTSLLASISSLEAPTINRSVANICKSRVDQERKTKSLFTKGRLTLK